MDFVLDYVFFDIWWLYALLWLGIVPATRRFTFGSWSGVVPPPAEAWSTSGAR
jgi:hypothetical protein